MRAVRRPRLIAQHCPKQPFARHQQRRYQHDGTGTDAELQPRIGKHRARNARQPSLDDPRPQREAAHVSREHRGDGKLGRAEDERKLTRPRRLVDERSESA